MFGYIGNKETPYVWKGLVQNIINVRTHKSWLLKWRHQAKGSRL